ncbi:MAG: hypothetical protein IPJ81_11085 [Chitinophagaceae bacterium]|nr:hypothetical protein [Chitinophagaceae bacterium]
MKQIFSIAIFFFSFYYSSYSQKVTYSETSKSDGRNMNFEIIGKMGGNFLIYKKIKSNHTINIYDNNMQVMEKVKLDFVPDRTFNIDFIIYPDFFYMIYQYQKKGILYCMGAKMNAAGVKVNDPVMMDTTAISTFADNKIYSTVFSEDKQKIMVFKIRKKNELLNITTILFDKELKLVNKTLQSSPFDDRRDEYGDFLLDNEGNFLFTKGIKPNNRDDVNSLQLVTKAPLADTFNYYDLNLNDKYIDEIHVKVDNLSKKYIITSLYYKKKRGNIEGLYTNIWDKTSAISTSDFVNFSDSLRAEARGNQQSRNAFDDYFIRQIVAQKDGGFLLIAESYATQNRGGSTFNRYNYFNRYPYFSSMDYYRYSPSGLWFYRPWNSFDNSQNIRYFYNNIMVLSINKNAGLNWSAVIQKDQIDDDNDNYLSFFSMNAGTEIHFLFNNNNKNQIVADQSINPSGQITRNATLKSMEKGYQFMPKFSKQVSAKQIIMPCTYRGLVCFAKVDFD